MNILKRIIDHKESVISIRKSIRPIDVLEQSMFFGRDCYSMSTKLKDNNSSIGVIAEFKRQSPSKGIINNCVKVKEVTEKYVLSNAIGLSILTDGQFFGGSSEDLIEARINNNCPILRKDFIIDEYQIIESKSMGADVILLIAEVLTKKKLYDLAQYAHGLGLEVLMEVHNKEALKKYNEYVNMVGVNNRDLKTFDVSIEHSIAMVNHLPKEACKISESGIHSYNEAIALKRAGFDGVLIGERFMKSKNPGEACNNFIQSVSMGLNQSIPG